MSPFSTPSICPLRIMFMASYPCSVRDAVSNEKKPKPGLAKRLMRTVILFDQIIQVFHAVVSSTRSERTPAALRSAIALGYAAFFSTFITRGVCLMVLGAVGIVGWAIGSPSGHA